MKKVVYYIYYILSNYPTFRGTVPIFSSNFTAVLLFLCLIILAIFREFLRILEQKTFFLSRQIGRYAITINNVVAYRSKTYRCMWDFILKGEMLY